jgi:hypothetical protein
MRVEIRFLEFECLSVLFKTQIAQKSCGLDYNRPILTAKMNIQCHKFGFGTFFWNKYECKMVNYLDDGGGSWRHLIRHVSESPSAPAVDSPEVSRHVVFPVELLGAN